MRGMVAIEVGAREVRGAPPAWEPAEARRPMSPAERLATFLAAVSATPDVTTAMVVAAQHAAVAFDATFASV